MCFRIHYKHTTAEVAKRDITCYKVGYKKVEKEGPGLAEYVWFQPLFYNHHYNLGRAQRKVSLQPYFSEIEAGYHSFSNKKEAKEVLHLGPLRVLVKCIIPKGTKYYYNPSYREYVSETIIVQEFLD